VLGLSNPCFSHPPVTLCRRTFAELAPPPVITVLLQCRANPSVPRLPRVIVMKMPPNPFSLMYWYVMFKILLHLLYHKTFHVCTEQSDCAAFESNLVISHPLSLVTLYGAAVRCSAITFYNTKKLFFRQSATKTIVNSCFASPWGFFPPPVGMS